MNKEAEAAAHGVAMQIAAMNPIAIDEDVYKRQDYNPNAKYSLKKQIEYKDILTDPNEPIRLNKFLALSLIHI